MIRRLRASVLACGIGAGLFLGLVATGHAASRNPADAVLDRARAAIAGHEFTGIVRLTWWDSTGVRHRDVPVVATAGALKLADGAVVGADGRTWMRDGRSWDTLWAQPRDPKAPSLGDKYDATTVVGPVVVGRPTRMLILTHDDETAERVIVDRETGLVLRRVLYDGGRPALRSEFVSLTDLRDRAGDFSTPKVGADAPEPVAPGDAPRRLGDGFALVGAQDVDGEKQLQYSDGVFNASVFERDGELDWSELPDGGRDTRIGGVRVRAYRTAEGSVLAWQANGHTWTCVTDAPLADRAALVAALSRTDDSSWSEVSRFLTAPFRWV